MHPHFALAWFGYPYKDISYWVGLVFTLGCVAWAINGHYALYSVGAAAATSEEGALTVAAIAALIGGEGRQQTNSEPLGPGSATCAVESNRVCTSPYGCTQDKAPVESLGLRKWRFCAKACEDPHSHHIQ